jgi:hypothetical protein
VDACALLFIRLKISNGAEGIPDTSCSSGTRLVLSWKMHCRTVERSAVWPLAIAQSSAQQIRRKSCGR